MIQVSIPADVAVKDYPFNPIADIVTNANFRGADVDWYIKADDIILKNKGNQPVGNPQNSVPQIKK